MWKYSVDSARWLFRTASPDLFRLRAFIDDAGDTGCKRSSIVSGLVANHIEKPDDRLLAPTRRRLRGVHEAHWRPPPATMYRAIKATEAR